MEEVTKKSHHQNEEEDPLSLSQSKRKEQESKVCTSPPSKKSKRVTSHEKGSQGDEDSLKSKSVNEEKAANNDKLLDDDIANKKVIKSNVERKGGKVKKKSLSPPSLERQVEGTSGRGENVLEQNEEESLEKSSLFGNRDLENSFCSSLSQSWCEDASGMEDSFIDKIEDSIGGDNKTKGQTEKERPATPKKHKQKEKKKKKEKNGIRPNYFVAIQISNSEIHRAILKIQEDIVDFEPKLSKALVDVATSHITLMVLHIDTEEVFEKASAALDECKKRLTDYTSNPVQLEFSGVKNFKNQVVYASLVENEHYQRLLTLAAEVREIFSNMGVCMLDEKELVPHLTIAKVSKAPHRKGKTSPRKISPTSYKHHEDIHFGSQQVLGLQLLSMNKPKDKARYYQCPKAVSFDLKREEDEDHRQCCFREGTEKQSNKSSTNKLKDGPEEEGGEPQNSNSFSISPLAAVMTCAAALVLAVMVTRFRARQ